MKDFRTVVRISPSSKTIGLKTQVLTTGSCFANAIGDRLQAFKVPGLSNPFGTAYNPIAIHKTLEYALENTQIPTETIVSAGDLHFQYDFHSDFSSPEKSTLQSMLQETVDRTHSTLRDASWLIITYGTAWAYYRKENGEVVSNCHKQPSALFEKKLLSHEHVVESFHALYQKLKAINPTLSIILTVSPVRHIKDTLELNSVSKSILRLACHSLQEHYPEVDYFPAFEIMNDDLRDYRFYKRDMLHPSTEAEDYIWEMFVERYADQSFKSFIPRWASIQAALAHKPFHPQSQGHQRFIRDTLAKLEEFKNLVSIEKEKAWLQAQIQPA